MYRTYSKNLNSDQGDFQLLVKSGMFEKFEDSFQGVSLMIRAGSHV